MIFYFTCSTRPITLSRNGWLVWIFALRQLGSESALA